MHQSSKGGVTQATRKEEQQELGCWSLMETQREHLPSQWVGHYGIGARDYLGHRLAMTSRRCDTCSKDRLLESWLNTKQAACTAPSLRSTSQFLNTRTGESMHDKSSIQKYQLLVMVCIHTHTQASPLQDTWNSSRQNTPRTWFLKSQSQFWYRRKRSADGNLWSISWPMLYNFAMQTPRM